MWAGDGCARSRAAVRVQVAPPGPLPESESASLGVSIPTIPVFPSVPVFPCLTPNAPDPVNSGDPSKLPILVLQALYLPHLTQPCLAQTLAPSLVCTPARETLSEANLLYHVLPSRGEGGDRRQNVSHLSAWDRKGNQRRGGPPHRGHGW